MNNKDVKRKGRADDDVVVFSLSYIYWNPQSTFKMSMSAVYILDLKGKVCMIHFVSYNTVYYCLKCFKQRKIDMNSSHHYVMS